MLRLARILPALAFVLTATCASGQETASGHTVPVNGIGATSYFPEQARSILRKASADDMPPEVQEMYRECATRGDAQVRQLAAQFNGFHNSYDDMNFTGPYLSTISARTLIVHGDRDPFFPVEIPVSVYRSIPDASLWIIPGGGHVPVHDPAVPFTATALRFLDDAGGK